MSLSKGLIYHRMFCPKDIARFGDMDPSDYHVSSTRLRIYRDWDGDHERMVRLPLVVNDPKDKTEPKAEDVFKNNDDITIVIKWGSDLIPSKKDPLYVMITDMHDLAIGFKISESGPIYGAEGKPGGSLKSIDLKGNASGTASLSTRDWPDEFIITLKPYSRWGSIFCAQGNGTKQCIYYSEALDFTKGMYLDVYREGAMEEYIINYIDVYVYRDGLVCSVEGNADEDPRGKQ